MFRKSAFFRFLSFVVILGSVAPHVFQLVETPIFRQHHVDHNVDIIDQNPLKGLSAFMLIGEFIAIPLHFLFHLVGYRLYLGSAGGLTNDKKIRDRFRYLSEIEGDDIFTLLFLYCFDDGFENFRILRQSDYTVTLAGS